MTDPGTLAAEGGWSMVGWMAILIAMGLLPFVFSLVTSFAKLVIVGGILRQALGTQQIPPNSVITGLAMILTVHVMSPVILETWGNYQARTEEAAEDTADWQAVRRMVESAESPLRTFLDRHTAPANVRLFEGLFDRLQDEKSEAVLQDLEARTESATLERIELLAVRAPAFLLTELTEAFQIGFLLFVPFLVIDLVVSNLLLAMGMHMLSPVTISLPFKLLLFVLVDGWTLLLQGVVLGYTGG